LACYTSFDEAIAEGVDAEAAIVSVSSPYHADVCRQTLGAGLHTLVEKPFTTRYEDAVALADLADRAGKILMVQQNYRYLPQFQAMRGQIQSGACGAPAHGTVQFFLRHAGRPYQHKLVHVNQLEMAIHHYDLMRYVLGEDPEAVSATE